MAMDNFDESYFEEGWNTSLRDYLLSDNNSGPSPNFDFESSMNQSPLPAPFPRYSQPHIPPPLSQPSQQYLDPSHQPARSSSFPNAPIVPSNRKRSHLDPPNFPLQADPVGTPSNTSGRPLISSNPSPRPAVPSAQDPPQPRPATPLSEDTFWSSPETSDSSIRSDTPFPQTEDFSEFVDLTQEDSSPPEMPSQPRPQKRGNAWPGLSRDPSTDPSNPAKRRKTEASQSSNETAKIEEIDLRDVDDDTGLSKVLEQQRMATIKAQQEQANKPVKLSTLQCIICMENMKDLTATHCGELQFRCQTLILQANPNVI
jgi:hypothetical protein